MREPDTGIRTLEVDGLGWGSALVEIEGQQILLLDRTLAHADRLEVLADLMADRY